MFKRSFIELYKEDTDPMVHQLAKLILTSIGGWITIKLIETAYNSHFDLNQDNTEKDEDA
jgi:hypothetical protein